MWFELVQHSTNWATLVGRLGWSVYYDEAEPSIGVCMYVCMLCVISLHYHNTLLTSIDDEWNKYIKEKQEEERIKKRPIWGTKVKKNKRRKSIEDHWTALIELPPFRLFSSLFLCLRQRSDQTESTISEAITLDEQSGKAKLSELRKSWLGSTKLTHVDDPARVYSIIFFYIITSLEFS